MTWQIELGWCAVSTFPYPTHFQNNEEKRRLSSASYPWTSANVIATLVVGGVTLFFILPTYEIFVTKRGKQAYLPIHLFKNLRFQSAAINNGLAAGVYYGFSLVFPQVVVIIYYGRGEISRYDVGTQAGLAPMAFVFAQMVHGFLEWVTGPKWGMIGTFHSFQ
jgi:hypothetical protein